MKKCTYTLTSQQIQWLISHSSLTGLTQADIVRRAIDEFIEKMERKARMEAAEKAVSIFTPLQKRLLVNEAKRRGISVFSLCQSIVDAFFKK